MNGEMSLEARGGNNECFIPSVLTHSSPVHSLKVEARRKMVTEVVSETNGVTDQDKRSKKGLGNKEKPTETITCFLFVITSLSIYCPNR